LEFIWKLEFGVWLFYAIGAWLFVIEGSVILIPDQVRDKHLIFRVE
jgi:hypothetical protein